MKPKKISSHRKSELLRTSSQESHEYKITAELFPDGEKKIEWDHNIIPLDNSKPDSDKWFKRFYLILKILISQDENADSTQRMYLDKMKKKGKKRILISDTENIIPNALQIEDIGKRVHRDEPNKKNLKGKINPKAINPILIDMFEFGLIHTWKVVNSTSGGLFYKISEKGKDALEIIEAGEIENFTEKYPTEDDHPLRVLFDKLQS